MPDAGAPPMWPPWPGETRPVLGTRPDRLADVTIELRAVAYPRPGAGPVTIHIPSTGDGDAMALAAARLRWLAAWLDNDRDAAEFESMAWDADHDGE